MLARLGLDRTRRLIAVLLLFGVFFAGSVDAVACEPLLEEAAHAMEADTGTGEEPAEAPEKHGLCAHGHCHHGAQMPQIAPAIESLPLDAVGYRASSERRLASAMPDGLKRPPRA